jgi:hypothetical protein
VQLPRTDILANGHASLGNLHFNDISVLQISKGFQDALDRGR